MTRAVSATEAKNRFGTVLEWVIDKGDDVIVERHGKPGAVIISVAEYEEVKAFRERKRREEALATLRALRDKIAARNRDMTEEEIEEFADRATREAVDSLVSKGKIRFQP